MRFLVLRGLLNPLLRPLRELLKFGVVPRVHIPLEGRRGGRRGRKPRDKRRHRVDVGVFAVVAQNDVNATRPADLREQVQRFELLVGVLDAVPAAQELAQSALFGGGKRDGLGNLARLLFAVDFHRQRRDVPRENNLVAVLLVKLAVLLADVDDADANRGVHAGRNRGERGLDLIADFHFR